MMGLFSKWFWLLLIIGLVVMFKAVSHFSDRWSIGGRKSADEVEQEEIQQEQEYVSERSQVIYQIKGELSEKLVKGLFPDLTVDAGLVVGYVLQGQEKRTLATLAALDIPADHPDEPIDLPQLLPIAPVADQIKQPEVIDEGLELVPLSYRFINRQPDAALQAALVASQSDLFLDPDSGEVFGRVMQKEYEAMEQYLRRLDTLAGTVRVEAAFLQATLSGGEDFSVSWFLEVGTHRGLSSADFRLTSTPSNFTISASQFGLTLESAIRSGRVKVVSRPVVGVALGSEAVLRSGREIAIPTSTVSNGVIQQQIEFTAIEFLVRVMVRKLESNYRVTVEQESKEVLGFTEIDGNGIPEIGSQGMISVIDCRHDEWVLLGGIAKKSESSAKSRNRLFSKSRTQTQVREELVLAFRITDQEQVKPAQLEEPFAYAKKLK